ncbi:MULTISPECIES: DEAD/DEAH box helicase family protein [Sinorhizobium]|uniref:DNA or RNA helicase n=1 Tax=Rhizobium meliloti (strain 1021) TaxID=266834 RepID=B2REE6_RHIME|nr:MULTISPECIES: DEAD/DEAH box helicase family protein [Sinorhizobium]TWA91499.1 hypothetical protein FB000_13077 [Ensifer sp. SEMIA 134]TWB28015.1 hypothetical protein FB001_12815 [Ensifer sp. SEMIA 135]AGG75743.1 Putative DNA or RNA helicase [Sinorhizobium meliloti 2011]MCK3802131.1 DNA/RNA helicase [Sinorhizobium meliloti]MCK3806036.1 DNA/RNA helicase [Sinorhizobium meliloti]
MIELIGEQGSSEHQAALLVRDALVRAWPGIDVSPPEDDHVKIASSAKLSGQKVSDVDVVVAGRFRTKRYIIPKSNAKDVDGNSIVGTKVRVRSFIVAVEVKDHSFEAMRMEAGGVMVRYPGGWKSATEQNEAQRYALVGHFRDTIGANPWVNRCLVLLGIHELPRHRGLPQPAAGAVPAVFDATQFLMAAASVYAVRKVGNEHAISSGNDELVEQVLQDGLFQEMMPSNLDRRRMDRIASRPPEARELAALLGGQRVHLRGHGGTGKTILLLQAAYEAFMERGTRSLVLTYNVALAADIQRTIALMGIPSGGETGGITVRTVMSFTYSWLDRLGLGKGGEIDFDRYEEALAEALEYLSSGAIGQQEVDSIKRASPIEFGFDAILVDEAQDWPQVEANLLVNLYGGQAISLADGISQLVRGQATDWRSSVAGQPKDGDRILRDGLRMKASLCRFANTVADEVGLQWRVTPNREAPGGRVIIRTGNYADMAELQRVVLASAITSRNMPVDLLHCVPPSGVRSNGTRRGSLLAEAFRQNGWTTWDAVDEGTRRTFPRSAESLRIVQYESCRGLEGWITVLDGLDEFWRLARTNAARSLAERPSEETLDAIAWRWTMIPITRPIDTLIITLRDPDSSLAGVVFGLARRLPDIIDLA